MEKQFLQFKIQKAADDSITIVASDETLDRAGEVLPLDSWDLSNYRKNPVLLVDHDYKVSNIVGKAKDLKVNDRAFTFSPEFHNITQLAREVSEMVKSDFAPAVSVGFLPHGPKKDGDRPVNELLEISFVAVPANPNALSLAMKSIKDEEVKKVEEWVKKDEDPKSEEKPDPSVDDIAVNENEKSITLLFNDKSEAKYNLNPDQAEKFLKNFRELAELKEGRVLSGKNRKRIEDAVSILKQASEALSDLLSATENADKGAGDQSRDPKVAVEEKKAAEKLPSPVRRALQKLNRETNTWLANTK